MRLLVLSLLFAVALALASPATADVERYAASGSGRMELQNGTGKVVVAGRGALLGRFARGRIVVVDLPRGARTVVTVTGHERARRLGPRTVLYSGRDVDFFVGRGAWRVRIARARAIHASIALRGSVTLAGTGRYAIDGRRSRPWPRTPRTFRLGR